MPEIISEHVLDRLRMIGDPMFKNGSLGGIGVRELVEARDLAVLDKIGLELAAPRRDGEKLLLAQQLFARYGNEIAAALLLAALPQAYAAVDGSKVLLASADLPHNFPRRIARTATFLLAVTRRAKDAADAKKMWSPDGWPPEESPVAACSMLRIVHELTRQKVRADHKRPIPADSELLNQQELLAMLLTFTVSVFEVLERFGCPWTPDEQEAYLHLWDVIGGYLGIGATAVLGELASMTGSGQAFQVVSDGDGTEFQVVSNGVRWLGLRPATIEQTRQLLRQLRQRLWRPPSRPSEGAMPDEYGDWTRCRAGQILIRTHLNELSLAMPRMLRSFPATVVRQLAAPVVRENLNLGGSGLMAALGTLRSPELVPDDFAAPRPVNRAEAQALRSMANEVARRALLNFVRSGQTTLPGFPEGWTDGLLDPLEVASGRA
jgi:hypothetical protein